MLKKPLLLITTLIKRASFTVPVAVQVSSQQSLEEIYQSNLVNYYHWY